MCRSSLERTMQGLKELYGLNIVSSSNNLVVDQHAYW
jgi:hypothetical protein